jgi:hypothetical protein
MDGAYCGGGGGGSYQLPKYYLLLAARGTARHAQGRKTMKIWRERACLGGFPPHSSHTYTLQSEGSNPIDTFDHPLFSRT